MGVAWMTVWLTGAVVTVIFGCIEKISLDH